MTVAEVERKIIKPQPGPQEAFLASPADIAIAGGAAGGGKTFALLMEPLRHVTNKNFGAVIFRRTSPQIMKTGGLWDEAYDIYPDVGGVPTSGGAHGSRFVFPSGMDVKFSHLEHEKTRLEWKSTQVPLLLFDQLEDFTEKMFWYMQSRNRSAKAGIQPYLRGTCNPVPPDDLIGGWLNKLISWWIDQETGYAIPERSGVLRWFVRLSDKMYWANSTDELWKICKTKYPDLDKESEFRPQSLSFIPAKLSDNKILEQNDPSYRSKLLGLPNVERERLLEGNWKIKEAAGNVFNRAWFKPVSVLPLDVVRWVRYWDKAGTAESENPGSARSAGVLIGKRKNGRFIVASSVCNRWGALDREKVILQTAHSDRASYGRALVTWTEQEGGSGGKESAQSTVKNLAGFIIRTETATGKKIVRAQPFAAQVQAGNVDILEGPWNEDYLSEMHNFDGLKGLMDQVDGSSGAFNKLATGRSPGDPIIF